MKNVDKMDWFSNHLLHGADYNPEQWLHDPTILDQDILLMKQANCNVMSIGIFSWSLLEPEEGKYEWDWMDQVINKLHENGISIFLATPSGARPVWLAQSYPEVLRVGPNRQRNLYGARHNHCYTSPIYREKIAQINQQLSARYANHPAVQLWHISNEYGGDCHCDLCQDAFRTWLQQKYETLDQLNAQWWTTFWSHRYTDWSQIESPAPHGEQGTHGLNLDWKRFVTDQTLNFMQHEIAAVKTSQPTIPVTTNFMYYFEGLNYFKFKQTIDIVSWDNYPTWHKEDNGEIAIDTAMFHDMMRSIKRQPFLLMESSPSSTNWQSVSKLKKPGMHILSSMQAVAHGSNSVQYFQWRKSRGASEKFHGAVVSHNGSPNTRVFREVAELGTLLHELSEVANTDQVAQVAIVYDWENKWAIEDSEGPRNKGMGYKEEVQLHYQAFLQQGVTVDFVDMECELEGYELVIAPMLYMQRAGFELKLRSFVEKGGTLVMTYWSGIVNENDLVFLGDAPHGLTDIAGVISEEIDGLYEHEHNCGEITLQLEGRHLAGQYTCTKLCDQMHLHGAEILMVYTDNFYADRPVLTRHRYKKGQTYYIGSQFEPKFYQDLYQDLLEQLSIHPPVQAQMPEGVFISTRSNEYVEYVFVQNFTEKHQIIPALGEAWTAVNAEVDLRRIGSLKPLDILVAKRSLI
ncbi:beta-galactosidase [Paenibacillus shirakamiensis]|uniref:Beta-galactosidase n=1 Tax=Paenibacillus shirakamiensis TaxID=1265935 RepID=A0ABS4JEI7_9BACL|nr:beta-galactosidase [Paenibacillus shirakamiensis]MBP2000108.1 beta-galactosidase [Paenibacillus shirakamiensis]